MAEYLSPGVYIEEVEMGAKPIQGVSTSTVGFVGKGVNIITFSDDIVAKLIKFDSIKDQKTNLDKLKADITKAKTKAEADKLTVDFGKITIKTIAVDTDEKNKINRYFSVIENKIIKVKSFIDTLNKPIFVSSWSDYKNKFGINSDGDVTTEGYLPPAVYSFFANGGKRCYIVSTLGIDKTSIIGTNTNGKRSGLIAFEEVDEVSILCAPGITDKAVQLKMIEHCEKMKDRFAIFDPEINSDFPKIQTKKDELSSDPGIGALYYPWIEVAVEVESAANKIILKNMMIPPSGATAGVYARTDSERGVHKAPANEGLRGVISLEKNITTEEQDILNPKGINCIRAFKGRGIRIWGARTISSDPLWKYVNIRRLFLYLEESIDESTQWVVFEPNNEQLWARVEQTIKNFLIGIWKSGALMGTSPDEAFFVKCDRTTMTQDDINNGRLIVTIGIAPTKPAEFVIFRIAQLTASANS